MRIPMGNFGNVTPEAQRTRIDVGNVDAPTNALQHLATVGIGVAEDQQRQIAQENQSQLQALTLQLDDFSNGLVNDPDHGLLAQQGTNAEGATKNYTSQYEDFANKLAADLSPEMRQQFQQQAIAKRIQLERTGLTHELSQRRQVEQGNFESTISNSSTRAQSYWGDNVSYQLEVGGAQQQIAEYGKAHGWTPEQVTEQQNNYIKTTAYKTLDNLRVSNPDEFVRIAGEPDAAGGAVRYSGGGAADPVGLRNNNPGNLVKTDNTWDGEVKGDGRFASFATPEHGLRALCKNLLAYNKRGYTTVEQIIGRWAPPNENDTAAYTAAVSKALGVPADKSLDLTDINTLAALCASITQHENGSNPYSQEQISTGAMSALGLADLPRPEGVPLRAAGTATAVTQVDPVQLERLRSQAMAQINQQRAVYAQQLGTSMKDAYAAYDEGLQPQGAPSQSDLLRAYGPVKGMQQWQDLQQQQKYGGTIAAAKEMSPAGRQDLLERLRPSDPNTPNFAANQQRWDKMQAKFKQLDTEWEKNQGSNRFESSLQNNFPLDPNDKNNQAAADHYFDRQVAPGFNINNADSLNQVAEITTKSGMLPTQIKTMLTAGATSRDPAVVVPMAKMYGQIFDNNPAAATGVDKGAMAFYSKVYAYDRSGVPAEKAVDMAYNQVYQQDDRLKQMISQQVRDKDYIKDRTTAAQDNINSLSPSLTPLGAPSISAAGQANQLYQRDYQTIYDANFAQAGGDADQAKAMTNAMIKKVWAVSTINGKEEVMKYAPEAVYGVTNGSGNWIQGQWEEERRALKGAAFGGARDDTDLVLVPDMLTPRDKDYAIMVMQKHPDGTAVPTPYAGKNGMPLRFRPEQQSSPMYKATMGQQQQRVDAARAARQEEQQPAFTNQHGYTPPDLTKPFGTGIANQLPSNITAGGQ